MEARTAQVRELAGQLTMAEHEERTRTAQVLHDDLQQRLYGLQIQLEFLRAESESEALRPEMAGMERLLIDAMHTARELSLDLSPPLLEGEWLGEAFNWLGTHMQERYQLRVDVGWRTLPLCRCSPSPVFLRSACLSSTCGWCL